MTTSFPSRVLVNTTKQYAETGTPQALQAMGRGEEIQRPCATGIAWAWWLAGELIEDSRQGKVPVSANWRKAGEKTQESRLKSKHAWIGDTAAAHSAYSRHDGGISPEDVLEDTTPGNLKSTQLLSDEGDYNLRKQAKLRQIGSGKW